MYAHIDGKVAEKGTDTLVIDCGGVGYELICSRATLSAAPRVGERMKCYTILSVREDAMELFGFATREEKKLYEKLRSVSGIGPRTALNMLSSMTVRDLSIAIVTGDVNASSRAQGVGKKTAQRVIMELKEKIDNDALVGSAVPISGPMEKGAVAEAIEALMALGYNAPDAQRAIAAVSDSADTVDKLVFRALRGMDNGGICTNMRKMVIMRLNSALKCSRAMRRQYAAG